MPKGTDLSVHSAKDLARFAASFNNRPRKKHGYMKPSESSLSFLHSPLESAGSALDMFGDGHAAGSETAARLRVAHPGGKTIARNQEDQDSF